MPTLATKPAPTKKSKFALATADQIIGAVLADLGKIQKTDAKARAILLKHIKDTLAAARKGAEAELAATGHGLRCAQNLSKAEDELIRATYRFAVEHVYKTDKPNPNDQLTIAAVGGYGRATLAPGSDIDLLFILPNKPTPRSEQITEFVLYILWDLRQKVGHAVRSLDDCIKMAKTDMTVRTATLESRYLTGDKKQFNTMVTRFENEIMVNTGSEFIAAKMAERDERHAAMGNTRYVVEPNVKDGKGGLRDLNTLFWIGKYFYRVKSQKQLVDKGVLSRAELRLFEKSENFLWAVRCNLHFLTGRADEKITFELQHELAERLGFASKRRLIPAERLMKRYFLVAKDVGDLTRIFCASLEFEHAKSPDLVGWVLEGLQGGRRRKIRGETDFLVEQGRINVAHEDVFDADPVNLIKVFWLAGREDLLFHPEALKAITRSLGLIKGELRNNKQANAYFLEILTSPKSVERVLRRMNESGVLGKFVPDFGKIVALMQFNMYHHYTVDEHLIRSVGVMAKIANGGLTDELPLTHELLPKLNDVRLLYIALFLHDIAKGRDEDHSIAGARVARKFCKRLGLTAAETETVVWLVEYHLVMSEIAQARDIQDPETAQNFADIVQSPARLALLMILTACDIRAVGPGVWTGWKGSLLRALYYATEPLLSGGHSQLTQRQRVEEAKRVLAEELTSWNAKEIEAYQQRHYTTYWLRSDSGLQKSHAEMIRKASRDDNPFAGCVHIKRFESITEISFYTTDHPRLLSMIAGACTLAEASIIGAQIASMRDGHALDTFRLRRTFASDDDEKIRAQRIIDTVRELLQGKRYLARDLPKDSRLNRRLKPFSVPAEVLISNALSHKFTVIEITGLDRTGLLHDLTRALADLNLTIGSAHISTYGEKAVDVFYVTDLTGAQIENKTRQSRIHDRLMGVLEPKQGA